MKKKRHENHHQGHSSSNNNNHHDTPFQQIVKYMIEHVRLQGFPGYPGGKSIGFSAGRVPVKDFLKLALKRDLCCKRWCIQVTWRISNPKLKTSEHNAQHKVYYLQDLLATYVLFVDITLFVDPTYLHSLIRGRFENVMC